MQHSYQLKEISTDEMNMFLEKTGQGTFLQSGQMAELTKLNGKKALCLALFQKNKADQTAEKPEKIVAAGMFRFKTVLHFFDMAFCLGGPILDYQDEVLVKFYFAEVKKYLRRQGVIYLAVNPWIEMGLRDEDGTVVETADWSISKQLAKAGFQHYGLSSEDFLATPRWIFIKKLVDAQGNPLKGKVDLLKSYSAKTRNNIKKAEKNLVYVEAVGKEKLTEFVSILDSTAERRGFHNRSRVYFENFLEAFDDHVRILMAFIKPAETLRHLQKLKADLLADIALLEEKFAQTGSKKSAGKIRELTNQIEGLDNSITFIKHYDEFEEIPISAALFIDFNGEMVYFLSGSSEEFFNLCGADLIQLHAQLLAIEKGIKNYNFFGTYGAYSGDSDDGIFRFKKSFGGGRVVELPGMYYYPLRPLLGRIVISKFRPIEK